MAYAASAPDSTSADGSGPAAENGPASSRPGTSPETDGRSVQLRSPFQATPYAGRGRAWVKSCTLRTVRSPSGRS